MTVVIPAPIRDILIEHIDGPVRIDLSELNRFNRLKSCRIAGLVTYDRPFRPTESRITEKGRAILAKTLADWAEALIKANESRDMRDRIKAAIAAGEEESAA